MNVLKKCWRPVCHCVDNLNKTSLKTSHLSIYELKEYHECYKRSEQHYKKWNNDHDLEKLLHPPSMWEKSHTL